MHLTRTGLLPVWVVVKQCTSLSSAAATATCNAVLPSCSPTPCVTPTGACDCG
jgi:hypothetical protein